MKAIFLLKFKSGRVSAVVMIVPSESLLATSKLSQSFKAWAYHTAREFEQCKDVTDVTFVGPIDGRVVLEEPCDSYDTLARVASL